MAVAAAITGGGGSGVAAAVAVAVAFAGAGAPAGVDNRGRVYSRILIPAVSKLVHAKQHRDQWMLCGT